MRLLLFSLSAAMVWAAPALAQSDPDPFAVIAYDSGYKLGVELARQDPGFRMDYFEAGFREGLAGDSARIAYALGLQYGLSLAADTVSNVPPADFLAALRDGLAGAPVRYAPYQVQAAQRDAVGRLQMRDLERRAVTEPDAAAQLAAMRDNAQASRAFLARVAARPGVQATPSGVLYTVDVPGTGDRPGTDAAPPAAVRVRYRGTFADGTEFDADPDATFYVGGVVEGFAEMLRDMREGETRTAYLPPETAYGPMGTPGVIPPNTALVFEITLLEARVPPPPPDPMPPLPDRR